MSALGLRVQARGWRRRGLVSRADYTVGLWIKRRRQNCIIKDLGVPK